MDSFTRALPTGDALPIFYDSPHSGRYYPADFVTKAPIAKLRAGEDAYVDQLIGDAPGKGVELLLANYPRCYIDLNRHEDDIDAGLLSEPWPGPLNPTDKSAKGMGLIRRYVTPGVEVHAGLLSAAAVEARIMRIYRPYHASLQASLAALKSRFGFVWHVDWHSMKSVGNAMTPDGPARRPDFVLGDLDGTSADPAFTQAAREFLDGRGYRVTVNDPYKGAAIVKRYGKPAEGVSTLQIEINRALYIDEATTAPNGGFKKVRQDIAALTDHLVKAASARR